MTMTTMTPRITTSETITSLPLPQAHHYIRFSISPPLGSADADALQIRRVLQNALTQSFGAALSHVYLDILWVATSGAECVVRTSGASDAASVMAAVAVAGGSPRLSALKESPFLPSVSGEGGKIFGGEPNTGTNG